MWSARYIRVNREDDGEEAQKSLSKSVNFANKLYTPISEKYGNIIFSPISINLILAMLLQGAQGLTKQAIESALSSDLYRPTYNKKLLKCLKTTSKVNIITKNKIYLLTRVQNQLKLKKRFTKSIKNFFDSKISVLNLNYEASAVRSINNWVKRKTNGLITHLTDSLGYNSGLYLISVIYFKCDWKYSFNSCGEMEYFLNDSEDAYINVETMSSVGVFSYKIEDNLQAEVIEIPYKDDNYKMIVLIPFKRDGIFCLEEKLQRYDFQKIFQGIDEYNIELFMPKFNIEETIKLNSPLFQMGVSNILNKAKADFGKMVKANPYENIYVRDVLQKCIIKIGTDVDNPLNDLTEAPKPPLDYSVKIDHPSIFMVTVKCKKKTAILFYGRLFRS